MREELFDFLRIVGRNSRGSGTNNTVSADTVDMYGSMGCRSRFCVATLHHHFYHTTIVYWSHGTANETAFVVAASKPTKAVTEPGSTAHLRSAV